MVNKEIWNNTPIFAHPSAGPKLTRKYSKNTINCCKRNTLLGPFIHLAHSLAHTHTHAHLVKIHISRLTDMKSLQPTWKDTTK